MQSIPGLKHCLNLVASLSKKLFPSTLTSPASLPSPQHKSLPSQSPPKHPQSLSNDLPPNEKPLPSDQKAQPSKVICFETYLQNRSNPLKNPSFKLHSGPTSNLQSSTQNPNTKNQQLKPTSNSHKNHLSKKIENRYTNLVKTTHESATQKVPSQNRHTYPQNEKNSHKNHRNSPDHESSGDQIKVHGKKDMKILKKHSKTNLAAQSLDINTDDMIFTYDDGDDISSIEAKSQTTDEIQPELLSFISKRAMRNNFFKFEDHKINHFPQANMKKKASHFQGETVQRVENNFPSPNQEKKISPEPVCQQRTKKRAFQLYPGETFEQFKKRILIQDRSSQSENSDDDKNFAGKLIKKQDYERILSQLNSSMSRMEEQKNKQASILVVQKMVDESESQQSENWFKRQEPILENIENYKVWDNAGDNASFRLYYRDN